MLGRAVVEGSPPYPFECGEIAAAAKEILDFRSESNEIRKWMPFDQIEVSNQASVDIEILLNGSRTRKLYVVSGGVRETNQTGLYGVSIINKSAITAITAGQVVTTVSRSRIDSDKAVYLTLSGLRKFFGGR